MSESSRSDAPEPEPRFGDWVALSTSEETIPGSVKSIRKNKLRAALFGTPAEEQRIGRYVIRDTLGRGGMGTVLEAYDETLGRTVALKLLHRDLAAKNERRLIREARALARLSHPNVVQVHEAGRVDDRTFVAMELLRGQTLSQWHAKPRTWQECVDVYLQAGHGLAAAHAAGLIHRDFKPSNCMIDDHGRVRVLDFGLVRTLRVDESDDDMEGGIARTLTRTGMILGTLGYMSPEQLCDRPVSAKSDQFSFCATMYESLYGVLPFAGKSVGELLSKLMHGKPVPPTGAPHVPARLRRLLLRGLSPDPEERWPSMETLLREMKRIRSSGRAPLAAGIAAAVALTVAGGWYWHKSVVSSLSACREERRHLTGTWDVARKQQVEAALRSTSVAYAEHAWSQVHHRLDLYAERWVEQLERACQANNRTDAPPPSADLNDRRLGCLGHRWQNLHQTVELLVATDEATVGHAVALTAGLPALESCDDEPTLHAITMPSADMDRKRLGEQWRALARVRGLLVLGLAETGEALLRRSVDEVEALGYGPARAEARRLFGMLLASQGQPEAASAELRAAVELAASHGYFIAAVDAAVRLASLEVRAGRPEAAKEWIERAHDLAADGHAGPLAEASLATGRGDLELHAQRPEIALHHYERALEVLELIFDDDPAHPELAAAHAALGRVHLRRGDFDRAVHHRYHALVRREMVLGREHPGLAAPLLELAEAELARGHPAAARSCAERAMELRLLGAEPDDELLARARLVLARGLWVEHEQRARARSLVEQAREGLVGRDDVGPIQAEVDAWLRAHPSL